MQNRFFATRLWLALAFLIGTVSSRDSRASADETVHRTYVTRGAIHEFAFDDHALSQLGLRIDSIAPAELTKDTRSTTERGDQPLELLVVDGVHAEPLAGSIRSEGEGLRVVARDGRSIEAGRLSLEFNRADVRGYAFGVVGDDERSFRLFDLADATFAVHDDYDALVIEAVVRVSDELAEFLRLEGGSPARIGSVTITSRLAARRTIVVDESLEPIRATLHPENAPFSAGDFPTSGPDVIVGDLGFFGQFGREGTFGKGTVGLAVATTSCNKGDTPLEWFALPDTNHPMIPMNLYRLSTVDGAQHFEQIGKSWMKHAFAALQFDACLFGCTAHPNATQLGVGCSDPYSANLNASQCRLGPRWAINSWTGEAPAGTSGPGSPCTGRNYPAIDHSGHIHAGATHRLSVEDVALIPSLNEGARYFAEAQYITPHEFVAANGNQLNNVSHREFSTTINKDSEFEFTSVGPTVREEPAIDSWPGAQRTYFDPAPDVDGRAAVVVEVTDLGAGMWHYEYGLYNMNLDRSMHSLSVPLAPGVLVRNLGFHAPTHDVYDPHSGEPWLSTIVYGSAIGWAAESFADNANANAVHFGTLYNFRFDANVAPTAGEVTVGLFKTDETTTVAVQVPGSRAPQDCNSNGIDDLCDVSCELPGCAGVQGCGASADCDADFVPDTCPGCRDSCQCGPGRTCDPETEQCVGGDFIRGGRLYDRWFAEIGADEPGEDHPLWANRPDQKSNSAVGGDTWRCKECHGWDYLGVAGQYGEGGHRTGFPGIFGSTLASEELMTLLSEPPSAGIGPGVPNGHDYGSVMSDDDLDDLVSFVLFGGTIDSSSLIDPITGTMNGDEGSGETYFNIVCMSCHGPDGTAFNFGTSSDPEWLGTVATENPWEFLHKVRFGAPGAPMPSQLADGATVEQIVDAGAYIQAGFPVDCLQEAHCAELDVCLQSDCLAGVCVSVQTAYGDVAGDGGSCGADGGVDIIDIFAMLDAFRGIFSDGCVASDLNIAGAGGSCEPDFGAGGEAVIDIVDIFAVLDAFSGAADCCP